MKKIITEEGDVYYFNFTRSGHLDCLVLNLYIGEYFEIKGFFRKSKVTKKLKYTKVEDYEFSCSWNKSISDYSLSTIQRRIEECIRAYKESNQNKIDLDKWDGYMGDEGARKKEVMRDQKIKDLLNGDTSKLEDFLNKE